MPSVIDETGLPATPSAAPIDGVAAELDHSPPQNASFVVQAVAESSSCPPHDALGSPSPAGVGLTSDDKTATADKGAESATADEGGEAVTVAQEAEAATEDGEVVISSLVSHLSFLISHLLSLIAYLSSSSVS